MELLDSTRARVLALIEVMLAFCLVHLAYRSFMKLTSLGRLEMESGLNFSPGIAMILVTAALVFIPRRRAREYGLVPGLPRAELGAGLVCLLILMICGGVLMGLGINHR